MRAPTGRAPRLDRPEGIELLEHALAYTRCALADVRAEHLTRPTPCHGWPLSVLLAHLDDALDAFTDGAAGSVGLQASTPAPPSASIPVEALMRKACGLLSAWSPGGAPIPDVVEVGGLAVDVAVVSHAAALEITVHAWDVAQATRRRAPIPDDLAGRLLPVAGLLVSGRDRPGRFAAPVLAPGDVTPGERLLLFLGRRRDWAA